MSLAKKSAGRYLSFYGLFFVIFLYAPVIIILVYSFNANPVDMMTWDGVTLDWYRLVLGLPTSLPVSDFFVDITKPLYAAIRVSLIVAFCSCIISTILGTSMAIALGRFRFRLRGLYQALMLMPMMTPDIILGVALLIFFVAIHMGLGIYTIIIGHTTFLISYVFITVSARIAGMSEELEEASADLGANWWHTFRRVTLPRLLPGVVGAAILAFIISMDDLVITYFIAGARSTTLPIFIYGMLNRGISPVINVVAAALLVFSVMVATLGFYFRSIKT